MTGEHALGAIVDVFLLLGGLLLLGGVALVAGLVAVFASGIARTVAACICGISLVAFCTPIVRAEIAEKKKEAEKTRQEAEYIKERGELIVAVERRETEKVKKLIEAGADVNEGRGNRTPLIAACALDGANKGEYDEIVQILLEAGAEPDLLLEEEYFFGTVSFNRICAMAVAIDKHRAGAVRLLVERGANIDSYEESGEVGENGKKILVGKPFMPFQWALRCSSYKAARLFLERGAKVGAYMYGYEIRNNETNEKKTLVMQIFDGYEGDFNIEDKAYVLETLLKKIDASDRDDAGKTAMHYAALFYEWSEERSRLAKMLLDAGGDINAQDDEGKTPLMYAVSGIISWEDTLRAAEFFTRHGADISLKDKDGKTALDLHTERYKDYKYSGESSKNYYDKIAALLAPKKVKKITAKIPELPKSQLIAKAPEPSQKPNPEKSAFSEEKHLELNDMEDNW